MKPEYVALLKKWEAGAIPSTKNLISACEAIADSKEPVLLTDAEIENINCQSINVFAYARAIEAACHAKQKAPVTRDVTVFIYLDSDGKTFVCQNVMKGWTLLDEFTRTVELK